MASVDNDNEIAACELIHESKKIVDTFLEKKTPGIFFKIELNTVNRYLCDDEVKAQVKLYRIKSHGEHQIFLIKAYSIKNWQHLHAFESELNMFATKYGSVVAVDSD